MVYSLSNAISLPLGLFTCNTSVLFLFCLSLFWQKCKFLMHEWIPHAFHLLIVTLMLWDVHYTGHFLFPVGCFVIILFSVFSLEVNDSSEAENRLTLETPIYKCYHKKHYLSLSCLNPVIINLPWREVSDLQVRLSVQLDLRILKTALWYNYT